MTLLTEEELDGLYITFIGRSMSECTNLSNDIILDESGDNDGDDMIYNLYDAAVEKRAINEPKRVDTNKPIYRSDSKLEKYLHICDLHIPFQLKELEHIISVHANDNYNLIINGDFLDCFDVSVFPKSHHVGLKNEVDIAKGYLKKWSRLFKKIFITQGNHEFRLSSFIRKRMSSDVISVIPDDIIEIILNDLKISNILYCKGDTNNWYVQIDNVICAHPIDFRAGVLGTSLLTMNYFDARHTIADVFICSHSHMLGKYLHKGRTIVESGCLCSEQDYASSGKLTYTPAANGYTKFISRNYKVSFNDIELVQV
jgi:hypothetical protein